ncbi:SSXT-like protein [Cymbomonas tetramitiformis]|uniref:SSXT-like protein n=1 Tax=Cymbomonas tetramitiformis TaxID=36881 RepID=A0AAE0L894_9CHLO|nr:SSXT-like protein [Cymbomonas tetramitiformis]
MLPATNPGVVGNVGNVQAAQPIITTEIIQKHLDENQQLILAILENQNLGKLNEVAAYQARLQHNLMYLAAIADAQPATASPAANAPVQAKSSRTRLSISL